MDSSYDDRFVRFSIATDAIAKALQKYKNDCLAPFGLRSMHLMTLHCLWRNPEGITPRDLARFCGVDKAFISRVTGELTELGYVGRQEDDGRLRRRLTLTERGRGVMQRIDAILAYSIDRITEGVSREQLEIFYGVLERFGGNLRALEAPETENNTTSTQRRHHEETD